MLNFRRLALVGMVVLPFRAGAAGEAMVPESYTAYRADEAITIDGRGDEAAWERAALIDGFVDIRGEQAPGPSLHTRVRMLWDDDFLYILAEMEEPHVWGDITERNGIIWHNNAFEIFINPDDSQPAYVEFEVNALGTLWDLRLDRPYRDGGVADSTWTAPGLQLAVDVQGTLNDPADTDTGWRVEWAIPAREISALSGAPWPATSPWRMNFLRVQWLHEIVDGRYRRRTDAAGNLLQPGYSVWTPQYVVDMHRPEHWGFVTFSADTGPPG